MEIKNSIFYLLILRDEWKGREVVMRWNTSVWELFGGLWESGNGLAFWSVVKIISMASFLFSSHGKIPKVLT